MLTDKQIHQIECLIQGRELVIDYGRLAVKLGLTKEYVQDYIRRRNEGAIRSRDGQ